MLGAQENLWWLVLFLQLHPQNCWLVLFQTQITQDFRALETQTPNLFQQHFNTIHPMCFLFFWRRLYHFMNCPLVSNMVFDLELDSHTLSKLKKCGKPIDSKSRNVGNPYIFHVKMWETHPFHIHLVFQHVRHRRHAWGRRGRSGRKFLGGCGDGRGIQWEIWDFQLGKSSMLEINSY